MARYDTLSPSELQLFEALMETHLRAVRPLHISFSFRNGVNRRYELVSTRNRKKLVKTRQMRRRASAVARAEVNATHSDTTACHRAIADILSAAKFQEGVSVVLKSSQRRLSPRGQALVLTKQQLSQSKWSELPKALCKESGLASREVIRTALRSIASEPGRNVWNDERGAHLVSLRDALECLLAELVASGQFRECLVPGPDGKPVPHTTTFRPAPELLYEQHSDDVDDKDLCLGLDTSGGGTSTAKLVDTTPNQAHPMSRSNSILLSTMPCDSDDNAELHDMNGPWMDDFQAMLDNGVTVDGKLRAVRLFFMGDLAFLSSFLGHKGASCRRPCVWCLVIGRSDEANAAAVEAHGHIQATQEAPKMIRTRLHLQRMIYALQDQRNDDFPIPLTSAEHLSIDHTPLFDVDPCQIVVAPLHLTLGVVTVLLRPGVEAAAFNGGRAAAERAAATVAVALLEVVRVRPVPYHGVCFAGRECHRISQRGAVVCDALDGHIPAEELAALRTAWVEWDGMVRILNRAQEIPAEGITDFCTSVQRFAPALSVAVPWLSASSKLHALTHHAPAFLRRFGSLGSYAEQALESWHVFFNHARAQCMADFFLGSCAQLVKRAAVERRPLAEQSLSNGTTRKSAPAGARKPKSPADGRLRANKSNSRQTTAGAREERADMEAWAARRATKAVVTIEANKKRLTKAAERATAAAD